MPVIGLLLGQLPEARTTRLLSTLLHSVAPRGTTVVELTASDLPLHAPYTDAPLPSAGIALKRAIDEVDGVLVLTPTHERSIPGALKHAIDWATASPSSLMSRPVAIAGAAAPRAGYFAALTHLRTVLKDAGATVMGQPEHALSVDAASFDEHGTCVDAELEAQVRELLAAIAGFVVHQARASLAAGEPSATPVAPVTPVTPATPARGLAVPSDPVAAVLAARAPGPASPTVGIPAFVDAVSTADPLVETSDPLAVALRTDSTTGAPTP
ncbi:MAG: NAD(P)H-dependent oxidoreductase [Actinomycetes bacterium]